ncbi:MAG: hypothetical protein K5777_05015 [Nitrosopumilus sp.]|nr:hypothetical protein [Nitrosopumilus sp.]
MKEEFRKTIDDTLDLSIKAYSGIKLTENNLKKFTMQFGDIENPQDFIQGYFMGELQGIAFATARCVLGRDMVEEERIQIANIIKSKISKVQNIIKDIKNSNDWFHNMKNMRS